MKSTKTLKFGFGAIALAALIAGGCASDKATTCDSDKACTDKSASCSDGASAQKSGCCKDANKAGAVTNTN